MLSYETRWRVLSRLPEQLVERSMWTGLSRVSYRLSPTPTSHPPHVINTHPPALPPPPFLPSVLNEMLRWYVLSKRLTRHALLCYIEFRETGVTSDVRSLIRKRCQNTAKVSQLWRDFTEEWTELRSVLIIITSSFVRRRVPPFPIEFTEDWRSCIWCTGQATHSKDFACK